MIKINLEKVKKIILNLYHSTGADVFFDKPIIGVASADDPLFTKFKTIIGSYHWTPDEALKYEYPDETAKSVIIWVLPVNEKARKDNRKEKEFPSREWAKVRSFGELANDQMRIHVPKMLNAYGYPSEAPHLLQKKKGYNFKELGYSSLWSERHAAFVAGLGTFGLSSGLITKAGVAMRLGTVITTLTLPAGKRSYGDDPYAWCTLCGSCIKRCPAHAIGKDPKDRNKKACCEHIFEKAIVNRHEKYGWLDLELGCGMCQTKVPCEFKN
jgi:epoxyqueuosine reductase